MTGAYDQYIIAFAVWLGASTLQVGIITSLPQLLGGILQIIAVWVGFWIARHKLILSGAMIQCLALLALLLACWKAVGEQALLILFVAAALYHTGANIVQPHWRAMMGSLVPHRLRGRYFGQRSRIAMSTALITFLVGGLLLHISETLNVAWLGFFALFTVALYGRLLSVTYLARMVDVQEPHDHASRHPAELFKLFRLLWQTRDFRRFTLFLASMQCFVAISAPFFTVYMLDDLQFTYLEFCLNISASIAVQFVMLKYWGRQCDHKGNRYVMAVCAAVIPLLPMLWLFSDALVYLVFVQMLSGVVWSGFSLSTANYLYDIQPKKSHFAPYAALNAGIGALAIALGSITGGVLIQWVPDSISLTGVEFSIDRPIAAIFILSTILRTMAALWYLPTAPELRVKKPGKVRDLAYRLARFTPISGIMLDIINSKKRE